MLIYMLSAFTLSVILQELYLLKLCKLDIFKKKEAIEANKKPCIQQLHKHKSNTPTMGGLAIAVSFFVMTIVYACITRTSPIVPLCLLLFAILGAIDDWIKLKKIRDGVTMKEKLLALLLISSLIVGVLKMSGQISFTLSIPFLSISPVIPQSVMLIFLVFIILLSSNSMNLTDGLDGLALGISSITLCCIMFLSYLVGNQNVIMYAGMLLAICLGTLVFNRYPAKVFMGDTGSLFLGGAIAILLIQLRLPLWIPIFLLVCMWEVLSVIIQLTSIRFRHKKVFLIAPYHHHLEKKQVKEVKIVAFFWAASVICGIIGILGYLWR